ncbi:MAG: aspartate kinase [Anaerolineae bacterium]|nr:aspartate kinase [Anaerolineae bacterium]
MTKKKLTLIMKFGGTSVGSVEAIQNIIRITASVRTDFERIVLVASAMSGVTNQLLAGAQAAANGDMGTIHNAATMLRDKHTQAANGLIADQGDAAQLQTEIEPLISTFISLCQAISVLGETTPRVLDSIASLGERMSVRLLAATLKSNDVPGKYVEASSLIVTDDNFQSAHPDIKATRDKTQTFLAPIFKAGKIPIVTGFLAATAEGVITTLGRGGSDYSAAILGSVLNADEVWIWTDVNGVMTADPRIVPDARTIPELTFREVGELAYFGAKVLHPKTIRPVVEAGIGLRVCNTFNPEHPGTRIVAKSASKGSQRDGFVKAVTAIKQQRMITIEGRGMMGVPGMAARAFGAVAATQTSVTLISQASSEQSICFTVPSESADLVISEIEKAFKLELQDRDIDRIWATDDAVIVTVVGAGIRDTPGVAGAIFSALAEHEVNIIAIAQGSSDSALSMVVEANNANMVIRALHRLIVDNWEEMHK